MPASNAWPPRPGGPGPNWSGRAGPPSSRWWPSRASSALDAVDRLARFALRAYDIEVDSDSLDGLAGPEPAATPSSSCPATSRTSTRSSSGAPSAGPGCPVNHVLGGINVSFWPMGPVLRRSGVVFIRRSIKDDAVYKLALRAYLGYLVERRYNLEWYLEGGRSRTGKLRPPRLGVLSYLVEAFRERGVDDVYLVPVSIAYDQLQEVAAMAAEEHGAEKKAESFAWMLRYIRSQGQRLGKAYVNFAEPVSLRQVRTERKLAADRILVGKIAFEVLHRINRVTPITPTSLLTLALLGLGDRALTPAEIRSVLDPLLDYVAVRKLPQAGTVDLATPGGLRPALDALVTTKVVTRFAGGAEPVYGIGENQHLVAAYSRNRIIHFFVTRAITELVLLHLVAPARAATRARGISAPGPGPRRCGCATCSSTSSSSPPSRSSPRSCGPNWPSSTPTGNARRRTPPPSPPAWPSCRSCSATGSSARSSRPTWSWPTGWPPTPRARSTRAAFLDECIGVGRQYRLQQRIHSAESISKELFRNALALAAGRGLLRRPRRRSRRRRRDRPHAGKPSPPSSGRSSTGSTACGAWPSPTLERTTAEEGPG